MQTPSAKASSATTSAKACLLQRGECFGPVRQCQHRLEQQQGQRMAVLLGQWVQAECSASQQACHLRVPPLCQQQVLSTGLQERVGQRRSMRTKGLRHQAHHHQPCTGWPLYAANSDQASWWAISQQLEEERLVVNSQLAARDVVIDHMAQELARYTSNLDTQTLHQLAQMQVPAQQAVPVEMQPLLLANQAPPDFEWTGYYQDGRTRLYQPQADARVTAAVMEGRSGAGAARDADMFYNAQENV